MLQFLKPKRDAKELGTIFANSSFEMLSIGKHSKVDQQMMDIVMKGANPERLRRELTAFLCFCNWAGMAAALQNKRLSEAQFDVLSEVFLAK